MKKLLTVLVSLFMLSLFLFGCNSDVQLAEETTIATAITASTTIQEQSTTPTIYPTPLADIFSLDQSPEDFLVALESEGIEQNRSDEPDGRFYSVIDGFFSYSTLEDEVFINFTTDNQFVSMNINTSRYATERGIRVGDSRARLFELYGDDIEQGEWGWYHIIEDDMGVSFHIGIVDGRSGVTRWRIFEPILFPELQRMLMERRGMYS